MSKRQRWFTFFVRNPQQGYFNWSMVAQVASPGLSNLLLPTFIKSYGEGNVRTAEGKHTTPPPSITA